MVNSATTRLASNLFYAGRQFFSNYMQDEQTTSDETNSGPSQSTEYLIHNWLEASFAWFQMAILWHDPFVSICGLTGFFSVFLLLTHFAPRFYATILIAIFCYNLIIVWFRHIWPEIRLPPEEAREEESRLDVDRWTHLHPQLMTINELGQLTNNLMNASGIHLKKLLQFRREEPIRFCLIVCSILSCTAIIGNLIDGSDLLFCLTTALLLAPGIYLHLLSSSAKEYLRLHVFVNRINQSNTPANQALEPESLSPTPHASQQQQPSLLLSPLSLFDQLKQSSSFLLGQQESTTSGVKGENTGLEPVQTEQVPITSKNLSQESESKQTQEEKDSCCHRDTPPRTSDDLSSNESTSLIDFEDDQQDGFVIL